MGKTRFKDEREQLILFKLLKRIESEEKTVLVNYLSKKGVNAFKVALLNCLVGGYVDQSSVESIKHSLLPKAEILRCLCRENGLNTNANRRCILKLKELFDPSLDLVIAALRDVVSTPLTAPIQKKKKAKKAKK